MTAEDKKAKLGLVMAPLDHLPQRSYKSFLRLLTLPENFDSRVQWPTCVHPIRDQA